jgi:hypothetical protein
VRVTRGTEGAVDLGLSSDQPIVPLIVICLIVICLIMLERG